MTHTCCPNCRLRFTPPAAAYLAACPECGEPPQTIASLELAIGYRLVTLEGVPQAPPQAVADAISVPVPPPTDVE